MGRFAACRSPRRTVATWRWGTARPRASTTATTSPACGAGPTGSRRRWRRPPARDCSTRTSRSGAAAPATCGTASSTRHSRWQPDLASVVVGMNDLLRHDYDADATVRDVEADVRGAPGDRLPGADDDVPRHRPDAAGDGLASAAGGRAQPPAGRGGGTRHDVAVLDLFPLAMCGDPALWSHDRIHGSPEGHARIAAGMAELLGLPGSDGSWRASRAVGPPVSSTPYDATRGGPRPSSCRS